MRPLSSLRDGLCGRFSWGLQNGKHPLPMLLTLSSNETASKQRFFAVHSESSSTQAKASLCYSHCLYPKPSIFRPCPLPSTVSSGSFSCSGLTPPSTSRFRGLCTNQQLRNPRRVDLGSPTDVSLGRLREQTAAAAVRNTSTWRVSNSAMSSSASEPNTNNLDNSRSADPNPRPLTPGPVLEQDFIRQQIDKQHKNNFHSTALKRTLSMAAPNVNKTALHPGGVQPQREHTEIEEELHEKAHIDYDRVAIVSPTQSSHHYCPSLLSTVFTWSIRTILTLIVQVANPSVAALYEDALVYETGSAITASGALSAYSGAKTGRSPSDKRVVKEPSSEKEIWWGPVNKPMEPNVRSMVLSRWPETVIYPSAASFSSSSPHSSLPRFRTSPTFQFAGQSRVSNLQYTPHRVESGHAFQRPSILISEILLRLRLPPNKRTDASDIGLEDQPRTCYRLLEHSQPYLRRRWICRLG